MQAAGARLDQTAHGQQVARVDHGARAGVEHLRGGRPRGAVARLQVRGAPGRQPGPRQRPLPLVAAAHDVLVAGEAADEADPLVPVRDQCLDHRGHAGGVVGLDGGERAARPRPAGHHRGDAEAVDQPEPRVLDPHVGEQEAVDATRRDEPRVGLGVDLLVRRVDHLQQQRLVVGGEAALHAGQEADEERVDLERAEVAREDQPDGAGARGR